MDKDERKAYSIENLEEGVEVEFKNQKEGYSSEEEDFFSEEFEDYHKEFGSFLNLDGNTEFDLASTPFAKLAQGMTNITDDGLVKGMALKPGVGSLIPKNSMVLMHYNAYLEMKGIPFDSTYQRKRPFKFMLGGRRLVYGLDLGVATMKKGGVSTFLVSPEYAYGAMGCPPRVPANATILYEVEIVNFIESSDAIEFEQMAPEEQQRAPFDKVLSVCKAEHQLGNDLFKKQMYAGAIGRYRKGVNLLEDVCVANEEEDEKRNSFLLKLYLNLAVCYLNCGRNKSAAANARSALKLSPNNTKALFRLGKAKLMDGEYEDAKCLLGKAQKNEPFNDDINQAIKKLDEKKKAHHNFEVDFCKNMFK